MQISPNLGIPTIDKIHLKSHDYKLSFSNKFKMNTSVDESGTTVRETYYYNSDICNITVESDRQGRDSLKVFFNPNKSSVERVDQECRQVGIDFSILDSQVIRADIERHQQLKQQLITYHSILFQSASGQNLKTTNNQSFRVGTGALQIEFYDKSIQAKLDVPNIIRTESRYLKPIYLIRENIYTLENLLSADTDKLMQLYNRPKIMYLNNLDKLQGNRQVEQLGNYISMYERLHQTSSRPVITFLQQVGIENLGIDQLLIINKSADIHKQKRSNARKHILKIASEINIPTQSDKVKEILSYFNLAS